MLSVLPRYSCYACYTILIAGVYTPHTQPIGEEGTMDYKTEITRLFDLAAGLKKEVSQDTRFTAAGRREETKKVTSPIYAQARKLGEEWLASTTRAATKADTNYKATRRAADRNVDIARRTYALLVAQNLASSGNWQAIAGSMTDAIDSRNVDLLEAWQVMVPRLRQTFSVSAGGPSNDPSTGLMRFSERIESVIDEMEPADVKAARVERDAAAAKLTEAQSSLGTFDFTFRYYNEAGLYEDLLKPAPAQTTITQSDGRMVVEGGSLLG